MKLNIAQFDIETEDIVDTVDTIVEQYTYELDTCIEEVQDLLKNKDDLTIEQLNYYIAILPVYLYKLNDDLQNMGIKGDAARMQRKAMYNKAYQEQTPGTVAQKTSVAQDASQDEQMMEDVFNRVYKKIETRIDMATMLHGSLKKILNWRISELEVTRTNTFSNNLL